MRRPRLRWQKSRLRHWIASLPDGASPTAQACVHAKAAATKSALVASSPEACSQDAAARPSPRKEQSILFRGELATRRKLLPPCCVNAAATPGLTIPVHVERSYSPSFEKLIALSWIAFIAILGPFQPMISSFLSSSSSVAMKNFSSSC